VNDLLEAEWKSRVEGLCTAFFRLGEVVKQNNWFHSRDFVFLCRMLRHLIIDKPPLKTLFDSKMLLDSLRRHFQTLDPSHFPQLAQHFLTCCHFPLPSNAEDLDAKVISSLQESLSDSLVEAADPTTAHCRYTMVIDPTDSEASIDLLFALKLLDPSITKVVTLSEFPEDATPTRRTTVLAQIKKSIENGDCLLLINSAPLQSALYDVINRHYAISVDQDGITGEVKREAFAQISLGSFSRYVRVHPNFRLIIHIPESKLAVTPMPFLNRMEKYQLSVREALAQRIVDVSLNPPPSLRSVATPDLRRFLLSSLKIGVEHFVAFAGGSSSFC
jgi:E3 ubiquitin-protein ligase RNF213